jgi:PAS domain S-box-containing protein
MKTARILIVENEAPHAMDLKYRVETLGHHVLGVVDTGEKAIDFTRRYRPDLILMDIGLNSGMDGIAAATEIWKKTKTPFVYITAYSEESVMSRTEAAEPYGLVGKPFHDRELQAAIEIALYKAAVESSVRRRERQLEAIIHSMRDGAIVVDRHSRITYMNPLAELLTGWKVDEALGREVASILRASATDTRQELSICLGIVLREGGGLTVSDIELLTKDDAHVIVDAAITVVSNDRGELEGAAIILQDASPRLRAQRELEMQKTFFQQLFEQSPEAIAILDRNDCFIDINPAFTKLFQYTLPEVRGKCISDVLVPPERKEEWERYSSVVHAQESVKGEAVRRRKDGSSVAVSLLAAPIILSNDSIGVYAIYREVPARESRGGASQSRFLSQTLPATMKEEA